MKKLLFLSLIVVMFTGCGDTSSRGSYDNTNNTSNSSSGGHKSMEGYNAIHKVPVISDSQKQNFLDAINAARADTQDCKEHGVFDPAPALKWNDKLYKAAYEHTQDIAIHGIVEHDGTNTASDWTAKDSKLGRGSHFYERITANGYKNYKIIEENVAGGTYLDTPEKVVDAWIKSPGHCANLMNKDVTEVGMALVKKNTKYTHYWSQEFGTTH